MNLLAKYKLYKQNSTKTNKKIAIKLKKSCFIITEFKRRILKYKSKNNNKHQ